ncbi:phosphoenolpyruvate--protein phosphotransferase [Archangium primigenium]|uniref:phosphoenolpyruvate--protein phosphotransferase n=1 Tax=[Archangium] primigenium TaxID=2792470 RepID=UPI001EF8A140|nr:phosphoenolpyruvate--protein phosphotransferase [Archangium primigenium]MBM7119296.1 phosphoenolpyruvate--protein phosphotransferase [Archangium primigenium]
MSMLKLIAPLAGWATRLEEVPDPAFSQKMVGDGIAVDPTSSELQAPCDGVVVSIHASGHACTLRAATGAEILLHIGLDTVNLRGEGFTVRVREGQRVKAGEPLISFDMDLLARRARSLLTVMVVVNGEGYSIASRRQDRAVSLGEPLLEIEGGERAPEEAAAGATAERAVRLLIPNGLHARPAAVFSRHARMHPGSVSVAHGGRVANGKSVVALMGLGAKHGDTLTLTVQGAEAGQRLQALVDLVSSGLGDPIQPIVEAPAATAPAPRAASPVALTPYAAGAPALFKGTPAAPGIAVGIAVRVLETQLELTQRGQGQAEEQRRLTHALTSVRQEIEVMIEGESGVARTEIFRAHLVLLDDPDLNDAALQSISSGHSAEWAWRSAIELHVGMLQRLENALLAERGGDLRDIGRRVVALLTGQSGSRVPENLPDNAILVADELMPSDLAAVPPGRLAALCTAHGGPTSHVAILAAGLGIPAVVAAGDAALRVPNGAAMIVDGERGEVHVHPSAELQSATLRSLAERATRREAHLARAHEGCHTLDGRHVEIFANLGRPGDAASAASQGAEGCGLLRSEFLFLERSTEPTEEEQTAQYQHIAQALGGRPLVIRTLDVGGDKPLAYLPLPREENPVLGLRGVRVSLRHPDMLRTQLRAILRVKPEGVCRVLVPMVTSAHEMRAVRIMLEEERRALGVSTPVALGAMIEVPVAAMLSDRIAREADFLSIGTNDLTQYGLAMDRGNPHVAAQLDGLHPGLLRLVASTVEGARKHARPVAVCGGIASDLRAAPLLIGLGVDELSVSPAVIPGLKAFIRTLSMSQCEKTARQALELENGDEVRALVTSTWPGL